MNIVDDGTGQLRALRTGDEIYFRQSVGNVRADTAYYAIVGADGTIRLAVSLADAMLYQTGAGQNDGLLALYPNMGEAITLAFDASSLNGAGVEAYTRTYTVRAAAPAQTAADIALYGQTYNAGYFFYFSTATLRNIENNLLYPVSAAINEQVFDVDGDTDGAPPADRFLNVKAGGGIVLRTSGQGSIGAELGDYTLQLPSLGGLSDDERANVFDSLPEADKAILSRANAVNLAGVYHTLYRYIGPAGTTPLDRASVDFSDTSLWQRFEPVFSNDASLKLGTTLSANSAVQFLFADRFGLYENSRDVFIYNSKLLEGASAADISQWQANVAAARANGVQVVDIGSGFLDPVWKPVNVPYIAQDGASPQALASGMLVGDMRDPRYLTLKLTRSLAVQAVNGVVSAYSDTTVGLDSPKGSIRLGDIHAKDGITITVSAQGGSIIGTDAGTLESAGQVSLVADQDIVGSTRDANGIYQYDASKHLQLSLSAGHALYVEAGGVARVSQLGAQDLNLVLANTKGTAAGGSSYQTDANLRVGQVVSAGSVTLKAGLSILNATSEGQRQYANVVLSDLSAAELAGLGYVREMALIAGQSVGQMGADVSQEGTPLLVSVSATDTQATVRASATQGVNLYSMHGLRLGGIDVVDAGGVRGDVRIYALDAILNGTASGQAAITARNVWLETLSGTIGELGSPLLTDMSGYLVASALGSVSISQLGANDLVLARVESRSRDEVHLSSATNIVSDKTAHPGLSQTRSVAVVTGGSLFFVAGGSVGGYVQSDTAGAAVNDALIVASVGAQSTINVKAVGDVALVQVGAATDAQGVSQALSFNVGQINAANAWLVARYEGAQAGTSGDIVLAPDAVISTVGVLSLLAGNNLSVAGRSGLQSGGLIQAGQRMNLRVDRDDRGTAGYGKASAVDINGRLVAPEIYVYGSDSGNNTITFSNTADVGGALDGNDALTQGVLLDITGGSGQDQILVNALLINQQQTTVRTLDGDDTVTFDATDVRGDITVLAGAGDDAVTFQQSVITGTLTVDGGEGANIVLLDTVTVGVDTSITTGAGADQITVADSGLTGALTITAGDGDNTLLLDTVTVGGDTAITTGLGLDAIVLLDSDLTGTLTVDAGEGDNVVLLDTVTVGGGATLLSGTGADLITLTHSDFGDAVSVNAGSGDNVVLLDVVTIAGATAITAGAGMDQITVQLSALTGALTVNAGNGDNIVVLDTVTVGGDTSITAGSGDDVIALVDSGLTGDLTVVAGNGDNGVVLQTVTVGGDTAITAGSGVDEIALVDSDLAGSLTVDAGDGDNVVLLDTVTVGGNTGVTTGAGADLITLSDSDFLGHLAVDAGAGDDKIWMSRILLGGGATVLAGEGDDTIYLSARALAGGVSLHGNDGNDLIVLDQLPSLTSQQGVAGVTDRVDVDGGRGSDHIIVNLAAALTSILINVHDSDDNGLENLSDVNHLTINGTTQDETFLVREHFVAKITPQGAGYANDVQRVNYDRSMTGGLRLNAVDGGNRFYIDDTSTYVVIDGGLGSDASKHNEYQVGQLYALDRQFPNVGAGDQIDTVQTTQGYLSRGNSFGLTLYGAENSSNVFRIYSNAAPLALFGGKRDDEFMVYAFKEAQQQPNGERNYVINGAVSMDGGDGINTYTVLGSEDADAFVLTQEGIRGAGLNTSYQNIQRVNLDAREGNDHIYVLSTRSNVITTLIGGRDSDTFDLSGDVTGNTIVTGRGGSRDVFDGAQPVNITAQPGQLDANGGNTLSLAINLDASVLPRPASGQAYVSLSSAMVASALYGSLTQGVGLNAADSMAAALQSLQGRGLLLSTDGGLTWHQSVVLTFDANGVGAQAWGAMQQVLVKVEDGAGAGLPPLSLAGLDLHLSASLFTTLPGLQDVALPPILVHVADPAYAGPANDPGKVRNPRASDQPIITVDPVTGISYANYADQPHDVSGIQGTLLIEGDTLDRPDYDGTLHAGVGLPSETDGVLGARNDGVASAAPVNDRIRIFNDGTTAGQTGMQDQVDNMGGLDRVYSNAQAGDFGRITGLGMTPGLGGAGGTVLQTSQAGTHVFDRGIVFHGVQSVNTMLGQGDDTYTVRHATVGTVTLVQGGGGNNLLVAEGNTVGGTDRPVLLFGSTSQDDAYYTASPGQRVAGQALHFGNGGNNVLDARTTTQGVILYGGAGNDVIYGGLGNDLIAGGGGNNVIHAGQGNNIVFGNAGMNINLDTPMNMGVAAVADQQSLAALTLVLTPQQAAGLAVGASADGLSAGANTITAGDGNNIVFANFGRIVNVEPVNYLRNRGDFIDAAAPGADARYLSGAGLQLLETINLPSGGVNTITVGAGRNALFGGMGDDIIRAVGAGGFNLIAGDGARAVFTAAGRIALFESTYPSVGGSDSLYNNGEGVMIGGMGADQLESGAGNNVMFGDSGRVVFVNDRWSLIETVDIAFGGNDILLAGTGGNYMLGGIGADSFRGSFSKDVMVGDFAAIYIEPESGRVVNLTRFGMGGNTPDLITRALEDLYSWNGNFGQWQRPVFEPLLTRPNAGAWYLSGMRDAVNSIRLGPASPDIVIARHDGGLSDYASSGAPDEVSMRTDQTVQDGGGQGYASGAKAAPKPEPKPAPKPAQDASNPAADLAGQEGAGQDGAGEDAATQDAAPQGAAVSESDQPADNVAAAENTHASSTAERVAMAAGVGILGLSGALGKSGNATVVFNSKTNTWEPKASRKRGLSVRQPALTESGSKDE
ncbi:MAG: beta strand repeat-containing protein [Achromobacter kerstersii]|uniref:beta strand repeat-containing protein n=1 Tax=Achromobacter kerstersii TaxID=1353890 RepID=UPI003CFC1D4D